MSRAEELYAELKELSRLNPLQGYVPLPYQKQFHSAEAKIRAFIAGNRTGKTTCGVADDLIQAVDRDCLPQHLRAYKRWEPPFKCWIGVPKFDKLMDTLLPKLREMAPTHQLLGGAFDKAYQKQDRVLLFSNGSSFGFKTYEQDVDAYASADIHRMHWDEEPEGDHGWAIRQEARARLIDHGGEEILTMTPLLGYSWVFDEIWEKRTDPKIVVVQADMDDNPYLDEEAKQDFIAGLTDKEREARKQGKFVHFGGLFYDEFNDTDHVVDVPDSRHFQQQDVVVGIDPGYLRTGVVWIGFDNDNAAFVFDELYPSEQVVKPIAEQIKQRNEFWGVDPVYVIDPSARNRATINAEGVQGEFEREGIYCIEGQNDRAAGILEVKRRLQHEGLIISRACQNIIWEFGRYRRDPNSKDEFASIKKDDHCLDAARYALLSRAWGRPPDASEPQRNSVAYQPNFQPPYSTERPVRESSPTGVFS